MLVRGNAPLQAAHAERRAIAAFSVYNLEQVRAVCRAATGERTHVIIQAGSSAFAHAGRAPLAALAVAAAHECDAQLGVHLDHSHDLEEIQACLEAGYSSVMIDGSGLAFDQNVGLTSRVVELAHPYGAWVEAELGAIAGDEDRSAEVQPASMMTSPSLAAAFVQATAVDALAVAVGNVHGIPAKAVSLDLERLAAIREHTDLPLVLHGASGLPDDQVRDAIGLGVAKVNVNTELRRAYRVAAIALASNPPAGDSLSDLLAPVIDAVEAVARHKIRTYAMSDDPIAVTR
ncbi:MAG TPA: class II fructose-bisphosphate aldolase [Solirubrobacteraceae bacterium]|jgi:ketose-bisphosphate aldolase|nr:class II fructose-bisphosphate aldolase [Solirubrobacteraceae bacterium]